MMKEFLVFLGAVMVCSLASADISLLGNNEPWKNVNDGDFDLVPGWRTHASPCWTVNGALSKDGKKAGVKSGCFTSGGHPLTVVDSQILDQIPAYDQPVAGDVLAWRFQARSEYTCKAAASMRLVFGDQVRTLAEKVPLPGNADPSSVVRGTYTITAADAAAGMPFVRMELSSEDYIKVFLEAVDLKVLDSSTACPARLTAQVVGRQVQLNWDGEGVFSVYRKGGHEKFFKQLAANICESSYADSSIIDGVEYRYLLTVMQNGRESSPSRSSVVRKADSVPPLVPADVKALGGDAEVELFWKGASPDIEYFVVYRNGRVINDHCNGESYIDFSPVKSAVNRYEIVAVDFSGNKSDPSEGVTAEVKAVLGASWSDLILPMPVHTALRSDLWGAEGVLPRDPENGIEDSEWSYWGGRPVKGRDGKYHLIVARWPEGGRMGHWEWTRSTTAYAVSDTPTGPYRVVRDITYEYKNGLGHNPDIIMVNDGSYILYSIVARQPTLFHSDSMSGPWKVLGELKVHLPPGTGPDENYIYQGNLSGIHLDDGRYLLVNKFGGMMMSESTDPLGPYNILTGFIQQNETVPEKYRQYGYEDPVIWRDQVQFHMMINAFWNYRCIYLRSPDGIHWKCDPGTAYTPACTAYEDGTRTSWYKLEHPHVLTDEYGRATHLSLAVIDTVKREDFANDTHSSKNMIMPLVVPKRITMRNSTPVTKDTPKIAILIHSEEGFDAAKDLDLDSLRFGASEEVNFGRGAIAARIQAVKKGAVVIFKGAGNGITEKNFVCKLIGRTKDGGLVVGYSKLVAE